MSDSKYNFMRGIGSVIVLFTRPSGLDFSYHGIDLKEKSTEEALAEDWKAVGSSFELARSRWTSDIDGDESNAAKE